MTESSNQVDSPTALKRRPVTPDGTRRGVEPGTEKKSRHSPPARLTADGYRIEGDDPSIVPWGYFEDDDL